MNKHIHEINIEKDKPVYYSLCYIMKKGFETKDYQLKWNGIEFVRFRDEHNNYEVAYNDEHIDDDKNPYIYIWTPNKDKKFLLSESDIIGYIDIGNLVIMNNNYYFPVYFEEEHKNIIFYYQTIKKGQDYIVDLDSPCFINYKKIRMLVKFNNNSFFPGCIILFYGSVDKEGYPISPGETESIKTWHVCDGTHGTPDLRKKTTVTDSNSDTSDILEATSLTMDTSGTNIELQYANPGTGNDYQYFMIMKI